MARLNPVVDRFEQAQNRLVLQASDLSLRTIADMVKSEAIDVAPEFQRRERWGPEKRSALIESFLLNIPVPPIYLAEDEFGSYSVIDGKQRITAIADFMNGEVPLTRLERFSEIEGKSFSDLPLPLQNFLTVRPAIRAVSLLRQSDPNLKYEVFHRLNSGGEPLNAQEIRNVLYRGSLNELVVKLGDDKFLRGQLKIRNSKSPNYRKMLDAEWVLRFLTLNESWDEAGTRRRLHGVRNAPRAPPGRPGLLHDQVSARPAPPAAALGAARPSIPAGLDHGSGEWDLPALHLAPVSLAA